MVVGIVSDAHLLFLLLTHLLPSDHFSPLINSTTSESTQAKEIYYIHIFPKYECFVRIFATKKNNRKKNSHKK